MWVLGNQRWVGCLSIDESKQLSDALGLLRIATIHKNFGLRLMLHDCASACLKLLHDLDLASRLINDEIQWLWVIASDDHRCTCRCNSEYRNQVQRNAAT